MVCLNTRFWLCNKMLIRICFCFKKAVFSLWASADKLIAFHAVNMVPDGRLHDGCGIEALMTGSQYQPSLQGWGQQDTSHCLTPSHGDEPWIKHTAQHVCLGLWRAEHMFRENNLFIMDRKNGQDARADSTRDQQKCGATQVWNDCGMFILNQASSHFCLNHK